MSLFLAGDVMLGRGVDQIQAHPGGPKLHEDFMKSALGYVELAETRTGPLPRRVTPNYVWGDLLEELDQRRPDLRIINLETAITTSEEAEPKGINYRMHPANAPVLSAARIDACALANNHVLDWGRDGLCETLDCLDAVGIARAGAGRTAAEAVRPAVLSVGDVRRVFLVALGSTTSGIPEHWAAEAGTPGVALLPAETDAAVGAVQRSAAGRRPGDLLVVSLHWGGNWGYGVPSGQRRLAHALIEEAGADLVHGHSSHHPKAVELHNGKPILYGCGDLLNDYEGIDGQEEFRPTLTLAWFADFDGSDGGFRRLEMVPFRVEAFRLARARIEEAAWLRRRMNRECARFGGSVEDAGGGAMRFVPGSAA